MTSSCMSLSNALSLLWKENTALSQLRVQSALFQEVGKEVSYRARRKRSNSMLRYFFAFPTFLKRSTQESFAYPKQRCEAKFFKIQIRLTNTDFVGSSSHVLASV